MKNLIFMLVIGIVIFALAGCAANAKLVRVKKERVDQEIAPAGNQGYLFGTPPPAAPREDTREYFEFQVEIPPAIEKESRAPKGEEEEARGTPFYVAPEILEKEAEAATYTEPIPYEYEEEYLEPKAVQEEYTNYTVQKGDTLQKVSAKFYGTTKKWRKIFLANEDKLKTPDRVYPGQVLRIPQGTVAPAQETQYIK